MRKFTSTLLILVPFLVMAGCTMPEIKGVTEHMDMISTTVKATSKASRPISDEEEYYVGRSVAARILDSYSIYKNRKLTRYVNAVGQTIVIHSDKPYTFGGYHFAVLDSREINAFACPGGIIFITKGMVDMVKNEDELAAVLAHEISHINHRDGIGSIKQARWTEALVVIGTTAAKEYGDKDVARLAGLFEGSIDDVVKTLVVNGYGREQEFSADRKAMTLLTRAGYDPESLQVFVARLIEKGRTSKGGMFKTHPGTQKREENIKANIPKGKTAPDLLAKRSKRFMAAVN